jgi:hypothetical protein
MNENEQLINEQLAKLPPELRQALELVPWKAAVKEIALANNLALPQISALDQETMLILYGFDDPKNYIDNLVREAAVTEDTALAIAEAVNEKIFQPISAKAEELGKNTIHNDLPAVESGEVAHAVPHDTKLDAMPKAEANPVPVIKPEAAPAPASVSTPTPTPTPAPAPATPEPQAPGKLRPSSDTPIINKKTELKTPGYRYPGGADPYREPLA